MTKFLIKSFVKDYTHTERNEVRTSIGKLSGTVGIVCNILLFFAKFVIGSISGSVSITADAFNNLSDASSSVINLLGFKLASKPADADHPYGHARYEYISGLTVAVLILFIGYELLKGSIEKIISPSGVNFSWISVSVLALSVLVKLWMASFNKKAATSMSLTVAAVPVGNTVSTTGFPTMAAAVTFWRMAM